MGRVRRLVRRGAITVPALLAALTITACAADVPSAQQPLILTLKDLNGVEKIAPLPGP